MWRSLCIKTVKRGEFPSDPNHGLWRFEVPGSGRMRFWLSYSTDSEELWRVWEGIGRLEKD